jgi:MFS family permease
LQRQSPLCSFKAKPDLSIGIGATHIRSTGVYGEKSSEVTCPRRFGHGLSCFISGHAGFSEFSYQIAAVAVGWQVYALTNSAFDLGMVGLVQFIPTAVLVFAAGHVADRYDRKRVVQICQIAAGLTAAFLAWGSFAGWLNVPEIFAAVAVFGAATAFESPAAAALLPGVAPEGMLQKARRFPPGRFRWR